MTGNSPLNPPKKVLGELAIKSKGSEVAGESPRTGESHALTIVGILAIAGLLFVSVWGAWDFGGGYLRTKFYSTCGVLVVLLCLLWGLGWRRRVTGAIPVPTGVAGIIAMMALLQSLPLGYASLQSSLTPGSAVAFEKWTPASLRDEVITSEEASVVHASALRHPLSVAPAVVAQTLWVPLSFGASVWIGCWGMLPSIRLRLQKKGRSGWLIVLCIPALAAGLFAFFGLADAIRLARETEVEMRQRLIISPVGADHPFGPFVNNNNAAGYLLLGLGCACGIFNALLGERHPRQVSASKESHLQGSLWKWIAIGLLIIVIMAGVLGSESRGGFLGMVVGFVGLLLFSPTTVSRRARFGMLGCVLLCSVLAWFFVSGIGIESRVSDRLNTLTEETIWNDPRIKHWQDAWIAAQAYFPAGSGFGTYRYAYLPYQQQGGPLWFVNADGMPVEWLVEGGLWLVPLVLLGIVWCIRALVRGNQSLRSSRTYDASQMAFITCATFTLPAFVVDQCFDYGVLHPPLLITLGMILGGLSAVQGTAGQDLAGQDLAGQDLAGQDLASI